MQLLFQKMHPVSALSAHQINKYLLCLHPYQENGCPKFLSGVVLNVTPDWTENTTLSGSQALWI